MALQQRRTFCPHCDCTVLGVREKPNHLLHLLLSIVTGGLWLIVWLLVSISSGGSRYKCPTCGSNTTTTISKADAKRLGI